MRRLFNFLQSFMDTVNSTIAFIRGVAGVLAVILTIISLIGGLATWQIVCLSIAGFCVVIVIATYFIDWKRKRDIEQIPSLLIRLDRMTLDYITNTDINFGDSIKLLDDISSVLHLDISLLKRAISNKDKRATEKEIERLNIASTKTMNVEKRMQENLLNMRLISAILNDYNVGLSTLTSTPNYQELYSRIRQLQKYIPSVNVNIKINDYFNWSEGLYATLLSMKPVMTMTALRDLIPSRVRANGNLLRSTTENQTAILIAAVRESISEWAEKDKNKGKEK